MTKRLFTIFLVAYAILLNFARRSKKKSKILNFYLKFFVDLI